WIATPTAKRPPPPGREPAGERATAATPRRRIARGPIVRRAARDERPIRVGRRAARAGRAGGGLDLRPRVPLRRRFLRDHPLLRRPPALLGRASPPARGEPRALRDPMA